MHADPNAMEQRAPFLYGTCICGEWTTPNYSSLNDAEAAYAQHITEVETSEAAQGLAHVRVVIPAGVDNQINAGISIQLLLAAKRLGMLRVGIDDIPRHRTYVFADQAAADAFTANTREILPAGCKIGDETL